ncbi:peptidylprolyl isomerase [Erythrobacter mangrovi]|uniref:peptidylprolyl isomerase n=1 Tax=Erythrobacter mangrovi TaxID=2739433 RepID=A0A7D3XW68_9SPHN|nr:peptidylprolyl isomerase [Erythrobacter mangrovi]QKG71736.1 peptidylprolyl isomerase [Erythrobacter mangrovi]
MTWITRALALLALLASPLAAQDAIADSPEPRTELVVLETTLGEITLALEVERAPITAANFLRYVDEKRLDGTVFYRAMRLDWGDQPNGLVQAGTQMHPDRILPPIAHEPTSVTGILHKAGTISMARYEPGTATGDFSIMISDQPGFDARPDSSDPGQHDGFAAFGHVVSGMEVVRAIFDAPTDPEKGEGWMKGQMLADPVRIVKARRAN